MNDDLMFEYLIQMGAMRPEEAELKKRQAMVDVLREGSMTSPKGQMVGNHYVAPSFTQNLAQVAQGYAGGKMQQGVDQGMAALNDRQRKALEEMKRRKQGGYSTQPIMSGDPYSNLPTYGNEA